MSLPGDPARSVLAANPLIFAAGRRVRAHVERNGFDLADFPLVLGAAGGPKWLVLYGLDRVLAPRWKAAQRQTGDLIGSSIGAWRFACWLQRDPVAALDRLFEAYVNAEDFATGSLPDFNHLFRGYIEAMLDGDEGALLADDVHRLHIAVTAMPVRPWGTLPGLAATALRNCLGRETLLAGGARRVLASNAPLPPPLAEVWPHALQPLTPESVPAALMATAAVPGMIKPVAGWLDGAVGIDGGILDYHFDPRGLRDRFALYPHFAATATPGWFDKPFRSRRLTPEQMDNVLMISPGPDFVAQMPGGKVPDRDDPRKLTREALFENWHGVGLASRALGDAFGELMENGRIEACLGG